MAELEAFGEGLWTVTAPLEIARAKFGTRMTVVRLGAGDQEGAGVLLIAPCPIDDALAAEIEAIGPVRGILAPNCFHHFYLLDALARFPDATPWLAEGVAEKLSAVPEGSKSLGEKPESLWASELDQLRIEGAPRVNEVVFFHRASRTLILTDFCFHFDPPPTGWTGLVLKLAGVHGKLAVSRLMRSMLKDRSAARAAAARMLEWDFDRLIVTHGTNISSGAAALFREATADL